MSKKRKTNKETIYPRKKQKAQFNGDNGVIAEKSGEILMANKINDNDANSISDATDQTNKISAKKDDNIEFYAELAKSYVTYAADKNDKHEKTSRVEHWSIQKLYEAMCSTLEKKISRCNTVEALAEINGTILTTTKWQRLNTIWDGDQQIEFLDTCISHGWPIPNITLFVVKNYKKETGVSYFALIDGLQRCTALILYMKNPLKFFSNTKYFMHMKDYLSLVVPSLKWSNSESNSDIITTYTDYLMNILMPGIPKTCLLYDELTKWINANSEERDGKKPLNYDELTSHKSPFKEHLRDIIEVADTTDYTHLLFKDWVPQYDCTLEMENEALQIRMNTHLRHIKEKNLTSNDALNIAWEINQFIVNLIKLPEKFKITVHVLDVNPNALKFLFKRYNKGGTQLEDHDLYAMLWLHAYRKHKIANPKLVDIIQKYYRHQRTYNQQEFIEVFTQEKEKDEAEGKMSIHEYLVAICIYLNSKYAGFFSACRAKTNKKEKPREKIIYAPTGEFDKNNEEKKREINMTTFFNMLRFCLTKKKLVMKGEHVYNEILCLDKEEEIGEYMKPYIESDQKLFEETLEEAIEFVQIVIHPLFAINLNGSKSWRHKIQKISGGKAKEAQYPSPNAIFSIIATYFIHKITNDIAGLKKLKKNCFYNYIISILGGLSHKSTRWEDATTSHFNKQKDTWQSNPDEKRMEKIIEEIVSKDLSKRNIPKATKISLKLAQFMNILFFLISLKENINANERKKYWRMYIIPEEFIILMSEIAGFGFTVSTIGNMMFIHDGIKEKCTKDQKDIFQYVISRDYEKHEAYIQDQCLEIENEKPKEKIDLIWTQDYNHETINKVLQERATSKRKKNKNTSKPNSTKGAKKLPTEEEAKKFLENYEKYAKARSGFLAKKFYDLYVEYYYEYAKNGFRDIDEEENIEEDEGDNDDTDDDENEDEYDEMQDDNMNNDEQNENDEEPEKERENVNNQIMKNGENESIDQKKNDEHNENNDKNEENSDQDICDYDDYDENEFDDDDENDNDEKNNTNIESEEALADDDNLGEEKEEPADLTKLGQEEDEIVKE